MTMRRAVVPLDRAGAGDLIGYGKNGTPWYLPGGGAPRDGEVVAGDEDDPDPTDDPDDDDDDPEGNVVGEPKVSYTQLVEENERLKAATARNNRELKQRRQLGDIMKKNGITDLDAWLAEIGVDRETGKLKQAAPATEPAPTEPAATAPADPPAEPAAPAVDVEKEVERRLALELAKRDEQGLSEAETLREALQTTAVQLALKELGFNGKWDTAKRMLDFDKLTVENGQVKGADELAKTLQEELPEWFRQRRNGPPARNGGSDVDGQTVTPPRTPAKPKWDQQVAARMSGTGR